jgi:hypothetical protein
MTAKFVRGAMVVFTATPLDCDGNLMTPDSMKLYLNYAHADGVTKTDDPLYMVQQTDGVWKAEFDTSHCVGGLVQASIRSSEPPSANDLKFSIVANAANPIE